jgi:small subunit ribosomal protein S20
MMEIHEQGGTPALANHKSAIKRARQNLIRRNRNMGYRTRTKNVIKEVRAAAAENNEEKAKETMKEAVSMIQKTASKGVIHKKKASRKISRLTRLVNQIQSS